MLRCVKTINGRRVVKKFVHRGGKWVCVDAILRWRKRRKRKDKKPKPDPIYNPFK